MFDSDASPASTDHPVAAALRGIDTAIEQIRDAPAWAMHADELAQVIVAHDALTAKLAALGLGLVREAERRELGSSVGALSTADWLRDRLRLTHAAAKGRVELAALLDVDAALFAAAGAVHDDAGRDGGRGHQSGYPDPADVGGPRPRAAVAHGDGDNGTVADGGPPARTGLGIPVRALEALSRAAGRFLPCTAWALRDGAISVEHAQVVRRALTRLPADLDSTTRAECEAFLAVQATRYDPRNLGRLSSHLATAVTGAHELSRQHDREADPAASTPPDPGAVLDNDRAEERAEAATMFGFADNGDGTFRAYGCFSAEAVDTITTALAPLAAPQPAADGAPDPRGHATRTGHALIELCRRAMDHGQLLPGARGARPHITVVASLATLRKERGCPKAVSMWATPITPEALRRLACDAGVTRVLTDAAGVPLDVGRQHRTVTPAQWVALVARDKGCAFPGCSRPAEWTQAHHIVHWSDGGPTDLRNLVLVCGHHHRAVHHRGWAVRIATDDHPEFIPPPWTDPDRRPRRNIHHRLVDALGSNDDPLLGSSEDAWPPRPGPRKDPPDHVQAA